MDFFVIASIGFLVGGFYGAATAVVCYAGFMFLLAALTWGKD